LPSPPAPGKINAREGTMPQITIIVPGAGAEAADVLRRDLDQAVGEARYASGDAAAGAKGVPLMDVATICVSLLGTRAVVALVGVIKSWLDRDHGTELEVTGPNGTVKIKLPPGRRLADDEIRRALDRILGTA
jgi:hypothetical protein